MFDSRLTLARPDLAARRLEGAVRAERFAEPVRMQCSASVAALRRAPDPLSEQDDQLLFGETFDVLSEADGWAWGQARRDGYVGYVLAEALSAPVLAPTHAVAALRTYSFVEPDFRSPVEALLSLNALVTVEECRDRYVRIARGGWIYASHLALVGEATDGDPVAVAERFLAAPYQWGGRESLGLDCSALVQQALYAVGRGCPRDADMQEETLGREVAPDALGRGDLVFWQGHVAWMLDEARVLHANSHAMAVVVEPLAEVVERIEARGDGKPTAYRRL
jgi:cell wall-associated NlpC family hydrolase